MPTFATVDDFLAALDPERRSQAAALRDVILAADPRLVEGIKWNSPNYALGDVDRLTINVKNKQNRVQLILHMGTARPENRGAPPIISDPTGLVEWVSDIRGVLPVPPVDGIEELRPRLTALVRNWLAAD